MKQSNFSRSSVKATLPEVVAATLRAAAADIRPPIRIERTDPVPKGQTEKAWREQIIRNQAMHAVASRLETKARLIEHDHKK